MKQGEFCPSNFKIFEPFKALSSEFCTKLQNNYYLGKRGGGGLLHKCLARRGTWTLPLLPFSPQYRWYAFSFSPAWAAAGMAAGTRHCSPVPPRCSPRSRLRGCQCRRWGRAAGRHPQHCQQPGLKYKSFLQ